MNSNNLIERLLRAYADELADGKVSACSDLCREAAEALAKAQARVAELETALRSIADMNPMNHAGDLPDDSLILMNAFMQAREVARTALPTKEASNVG